MSRSYKHTPYCGDNKRLKECANRRVRRAKDVPMYGKAYRKYFQRYDICDYYTIYRDFDEYYHWRLKNWHRWEKYCDDPYPDRDECWKEYKKRYLRK